MLVCAALFYSLLLQDPQDVEKIKKEVEELRDRVDQLQRQTAEDASLIHRLRQALKALDSAGANPGPGVQPPPAPPGSGANPPAAVKGPQQVLRGRLEYVDPKLGFLLVGLGERDGVKPGYRFEILREDNPPGGGAPRLKKIGVAEFEKFMGNDRLMSKLKVVEGNAADMRPEDEAVAYRDVETPLPPPARAPEAPKPGVYKITGRAGPGYVVNFGSSEGARQSQVVLVYRDGKLKAKLRLDTVERNFSVANLIDGTQVLPVEEDDQIYTTEVRKTAIGKVRLNDDQRGIFVDVGQNNFGAKIGDLLEVRRQGQRIGAIRLAQVDKFHSWARPDGATKREDILINDTVEIVVEK
jgi:hypothetical protein